MANRTAFSKDKTRLIDLPHWQVIRMECPNCGHISENIAPWLAAQIGERASIAQIEARLICIECGNRLGNRVIVDDVP